MSKNLDGMNELNLGIVGAGNISQTHLKAALEVPGARVTAVWGQNPTKAEALARRVGAKFCRSYDELLDSGVHVVLIGSPSGLHAEQGIAAARRGIHVLTEKPLDITVERADALVRACEAAGVCLGVFFQSRVAPDVVKLKQLLDRHNLGRVFLVSAQVKWYRPPDYYRNSKWRGTWALDGGGAVMNQGIHTVDLVQWLVGKVVAVEARTATLLHDIETEDTAVALFEFENGALGAFEATTAAYPGFPRRVVISGAAGTAVLENDRLLSLHRLGESADLLCDESDGESNPTQSSPVIAEISGHRRILEDFLRAIRENREPICSGKQGRESVAIVEALYESARTRRPAKPRSW